jgi:hypothetical protein
LNKLLFEIRHDPRLCRRLLYEFDEVAAEWNLSDAEREGAGAIASVGRSAKISDPAAILVKAGAHPLQALMSLHAVHQEFRKLHQEMADQDQERKNL